MKTVLSACLLLLLTASAPAQTNAVTMYAYSRTTLPGAPQAPDSTGKLPPLPVEYYVYVSVKKGTPLTIRGIWVKGRYLNATLRKVSSPVTIVKDPAINTTELQTLVPATNNDVYEVVTGQSVYPQPINAREKALTQTHELVAVLSWRHRPIWGIVETITALRPAAMM
jgi:hypothetical protein